MHRRDHGGSKLFMPVFLLTCTGLLLWLKLGFVFIFFAILPSILTYIIDHSPRRSAFKTVLSCNLATALHPIADMYSHGVRMSHDRFTESLGDMRIWLFIYVGAAAGWGLIFFCRFLAHFTVDTYHEYQLLHLDKQQDWLKEEWGAAIVPPKDDDD
jgi:hypothetical protein